MHNWQRNDKSKSLLAFILGAAASVAALGVYLYGHKGKERRERLERWVEDAKNEIRAGVEEARGLTREKFDVIVDEVTDKYSRYKSVGNERAREFGGKIKRYWDKVQSEMDKDGKEDDEKTRKVRRRLSKKLDDLEEDL